MIVTKPSGERRFTVIFDRGGFDDKLFTWLRQERIDFITFRIAATTLGMALAKEALASSLDRKGGRTPAANR